MKYHILNGDALKTRFPQLEGEIIVLRECLIEGEKSGEIWDEFVESRKGFLSKCYGTTPEEYENKSIIEFDKIRQISDESEVYFWFEDDLFCQVNFWFSCSLLSDSYKSISCFFVRAKSTDENGCGNMSSEELKVSFQSSMVIQSADIKLFANMWKAYQAKETSSLIMLKSKLNSRFSFVANAIDAAVKLLTVDEQNLTIYDRKILEMISENDAISFDEVFQKFNQENSILGLGDLQVKRMYDKVKSHV